MDFRATPGGIEAAMGPMEIVPHHGSGRVDVRVRVNQEFARMLLEDETLARVFALRIAQAVQHPRQAEEWVKYPTKQPPAPEQPQQ